MNPGPVAAANDNRVQVTPIASSGIANAPSQRNSGTRLVQDLAWKEISDDFERETLLAEFKPCELDVLQLLARGLDTAEMAQRLGIAPHTVEWHLTHVIEKLHIQSNFQAVIDAACKGLIRL